jgi:alpha-beta hydrolase superfamily lysophospholipase
MLNNQGVFLSLDKKELFFRSFQAKEAKNAIIVAVHGHGDHSEGLRNIIDFVLPLGFNWYGFDLRGHGQSYGIRGHVNSFNDYLNDLKSFIEFVKQHEPEKRIILLGHSLGGLISLVYATQYSEDVDACISICPAIVLNKLSFSKKIFIKLMNFASPNYLIKGKTDYSKLTYDKDNINKLKADPLRHELISASLATEMLKYQKYLFKNANKLKLPLLIQTGLNDKITPAKGAKKLYDKIHSEQKQIIEYKDTLHRPFDDIKSKEFLLDIKVWLDGHSDKR